MITYRHIMLLCAFSRDGFWEGQCVDVSQQILPYTEHRGISWERNSPKRLQVYWGIYAKQTLCSQLCVHMCICQLDVCNILIVSPVQFTLLQLFFIKVIFSLVSKMSLWIVSLSWQIRLNSFILYGPHNSSAYSMFEWHLTNRCVFPSQYSGQTVQAEWCGQETETERKRHIQFVNVWYLRGD